MTRIRSRLTFANVCSFVALAVALTTGGAYAADTILSSDIVDGEVQTRDLDDQAVTGDKLEDNSIDASKVAADSLTTADLAGVDELVTIDLPNGLAKGCRDDTVTLKGAKPGDLLITLAQSARGVSTATGRLSEAGKARLSTCNLTGAALAIDKLRVHVFTLSRRHEGGHEDE